MTERAEHAATQTEPSSRTQAPLACESAILQILDNILPRESIAARYARYERELEQLFAGLATEDCLELHQRLLTAQPEDPVAARFGRMILPRRNRLLSFLAAARSRQERPKSRRPPR